MCHFTEATYEAQRGNADKARVIEMKSHISLFTAALKQPSPDSDSLVPHLPLPKKTMAC